MTASEERRTAPRFTIDRMLRLDPGSRHPISARGLNISIGGLLCRTAEPVDPLTRMKMYLSLPDDNGNERQLEPKGTVLHCSRDREGGYALGIHFDHLGSEERELIGKYIALMSSYETWQR